MYSGIGSICQIGAARSAHGQVVNLAAIEPLKEGPAGATTKTAEAKGKILEHAWWLKKQGRKDGTILGITKLLKIMVKKGADLYNPETIKEVIAKQTWSEGRKENAVNAYTSFLRMTEGTWNPPIYCRIRKLPFIPTEQEIDALISSCTSKAATLLQTLKETGARVGEAWNLKWTDLGMERRTIRITPEKGSEPRIFRVTPKLMTMLQTMPKNSDFIFGSYPLNGYRTCFTRQRRKAATKLANPRLLQITFHTFRHWKATTEYAKTKDILHVMRLLGHKNIKNTLVYTQLIEFKDDEFICKIAKTIQEASELVENGFEYICSFEEAKPFRKRK
jgi:integrase